jgi:AcrR family transcriptional regulator
VPTSTWFRLDDDKRERVLHAAMQEFGEHGYSTGSLNTIAREAEIAKGSLFQYFADKQEFFGSARTWNGGSPCWTWNSLSPTG